MPSSKPRVTAVLDEDLFRRLEDFRYENRFSTASEALRKLIVLGLETYDDEGGKVAGPDDGTSHDDE